MATTKATEAAAAPKAKAKAEAAKEETFGDRLTEGAREMVKRSTATAKERAENAYTSTKKYNADLEGVLVRAAHGYANILGSIAEAAFVNVNRGIAAAEAMAEAKSISDAVKIQGDYVREQSQCSLDNARSAVEYVRDVVTENGEALRNSASNMWKNDKAA